MYPQVIERWSIFYRQSGDKYNAQFGEAVERGYRTAGWRCAFTEGIKVRIGQHQSGYGSAYEIARLCADLGDKEKAFEWLDTAYREHDFLLSELKTAFEIVCAPIRAMPNRFAKSAFRNALAAGCYPCCGVEIVVITGAPVQPERARAHEISAIAQRARITEFSYS